MSHKPIIYYSISNIYIQKVNQAIDKLRTYLKDKYIEAMVEDYCRIYKDWFITIEQTGSLKAKEFCTRCFIIIEMMPLNFDLWDRIKKDEYITNGLYNALIYDIELINRFLAGSLIDTPKSLSDALDYLEDVIQYEYCDISST